jgi:hypothetical protein
LCADQAANYSEMAILLRALVARGHECSFIFPTSSKREAINLREIAELREWEATGFLSRLTLLDLDAIAGQSRPPRPQPPKRAPIRPVGRPTQAKRPAPLSFRQDVGGALPNLPKPPRRPLSFLFWQRLTALLRKWKALATRRLKRAVRELISLPSRGWSGATTLVHRAGKLITTYLHNSAPMVARRRNLYMENYYRGTLERVLYEFSSWRPDAVILPEEVVSPFWSSMVGACRRSGVPVIITPYTIANQQEAFESLKKVENYQTANNWLESRRFPKWRMKANGHDVVRLPSNHILAHEKLRLTPSDPWMMNSGAVDTICVESPAIKDYFVKSGIAARRLAVTGSAALDEIHARLEQRDSVLEELRKEAGISGVKPILLVGGCPNQLRGRGKVPHCEHASMEEVADFVCASLASVRDAYDFVIRPHPSYPELGELFARHGFCSTMIPTATVLPVAALYIAFASATIRWAISCGIPTVNYDVFGYDYDEFRSVGGVFNVATKEAFREAVRGLSPESAKYDQASALLKSSSTAWSMLDGKSVERIEAILRGLIVAGTRRTMMPASTGAAPSMMPLKP